MSDEPVPARPIIDLKSLTPARVALGRSGASLPTKPLLAFTLAHARARDAVHAAFDAPGVIAGVRALGLGATVVSSRATDRADYLRRPDLGRQLDAGSAAALADLGIAPCQLAIVIGDGLSAAAVHAHAVALLQSLLPLLAGDDAVAVGRVVVASGARVALGDEIGAILGARMVVMLIGERPGLSAPDSLGAYLTFAPKPGLTDAERNCVSNIHKAGLSYDAAAIKIAWLVREGLARQVTGVALKDESADRAPRRIGTAVPE
ncbi:ethanolamine ammonia-lyase subunit EutC [Bradyrhizobium sp. GCM10023182]|uniref:Ethanolamine ammonia-lyase small subunit n=1 Tax=Bradyrhizobium zhengyangense TaxID=2911009 RepID=A0ABS9LZG1_9BRAD|nr:ethanolamine ammonia-lyase subunit EutC [Bradyrhizobium zhengyangense]MCG2672404.1 ethanolamine ammonia-lyase subunit EutC [Bradyrhizobium zhengyangense]